MPLPSLLRESSEKRPKWIAANASRWYVHMIGPNGWTDTWPLPEIAPYEPRGRNDWPAETALAIIGEDRKFKLTLECPTCHRQGLEKKWAGEDLRDKWRTYCDCQTGPWFDSRDSALRWWKAVQRLTQ